MKKSQRLYDKAKLVHNEMYKNPMVPMNKVKMKLLFKKYLSLLRGAAYLGNSDAQYDLGQQYEDIGYLGIPNPIYNPKKCVYWYEKACRQNHAEAYNNLARLYEKGEGCEKNIKLAYKLYKKSAELGSELGKKNYKITLKEKRIG